MEAVPLSETSVFICKSVWRHDPRHYSLNFHIPKNINSTTSYSICTLLYTPGVNKIKLHTLKVHSTCLTKQHCLSTHVQIPVLAEISVSSLLSVQQMLCLVPIQLPGRLTKSKYSFKNSWFYFDLSTGVPYLFVIPPRHWLCQNKRKSPEAEFHIVSTGFLQIHEIFSRTSRGDTCALRLVPQEQLTRSLP